MKNILCYLLPIVFLSLGAQNAHAAFVVRNTIAAETTSSGQHQATVRYAAIKSKHLIERMKIGHPKIQMLSQSNGYKALICGLVGLVILPVGIKAISYANAGLKERHDVVMARAGKILGIISYILAIGAICGLLGWLAYKNPGFGQAMGQILVQVAGDILESFGDQ